MIPPTPIPPGMGTFVLTTPHRSDLLVLFEVVTTANLSMPESHNLHGFRPLRQSDLRPARLAERSVHLVGVAALHVDADAKDLRGRDAAAA